MENKTTEQIEYISVKELMEILKLYSDDTQVHVNNSAEMTITKSGRGISFNDIIQEEHSDYDDTNDSWFYIDDTFYDSYYCDTFNDTDDWVMPEYECDGCKHDCPACNRNWETIEDVEDAMNNLVNK